MIVQCPRCNTKIESSSRSGLSYCRQCHKNFIFDKESFNLYHAQWRKDNPQYKIVALKNVKTYQSRHPDRVRLTEQKHDKKDKEKLFEIFGRYCSICGETREEKLVFHQIFGQPHGRSYKYVLDHLGQFVYICYGCHQHVHWAMKYTHLTWNQMFQKLEVANQVHD